MFRIFTKTAQLNALISFFKALLSLVFQNNKIKIRTNPLSCFILKK